MKKLSLSKIKVHSFIIEKVNKIGQKMINGGLITNVNNECKTMGCQTYNMNDINCIGTFYEERYIVCSQAPLYYNNPLFQD